MLKTRKGNGQMDRACVEKALKSSNRKVKIFIGNEREKVERKQLKILSREHNE